MIRLIPLALLVAALPVAAQSDADGVGESLRVSRIVRSQVYGDSGGLRPLIESRKAIYEELKRLVHSPSPDLAEIERLRSQEQALSRKILEVTHQATDQALSTLSDEERLSYIRSEYPLPPQIRQP